MLQIHFSNRYETLARLLTGNLEAGRNADAFAPAQVIVPSRAVERSLTLAIADRDGICANVAFDFLASWLWRQISRVVPAVGADSPFEPQLLTWRIYRALGDQGFVAQHPRLLRYLGGADALMHYELAAGLAALLRDYSTYREDWLETWAAGGHVEPASPSTPAGAAGQVREDEGWQSALYRRVMAELHVDTRHPGAAFIAALRTMGADAARRSGLPACVHLFALPTMPPQHVRLLQHLGTLIDVHLYVVNPCREYWFEVVDRRRLGYLAVMRREQYHEEGNRLLASWGRQTQSQIGMLVDLDGAGVGDDSAFEDSPGSSLLAHVQNGILGLEDPMRRSLPLSPDDRSLEVHDCHSLMRELEVLQDYLLGLFAAADDMAGTPLRPCDVLVVTPDLEAAAPLVDAVFGTAPRERAIPYQLTGRSRSADSVPARTLLTLLSLGASRFEASAVFDFIQQPIVARRFGLDAEDLQQVREWIGTAGIRWALDGRHRTEFDVPAQARHTFADGLERLFLGYALPADAREPLLGELLPAGAASGPAALALGAFWRCVVALREWHAAVSTPQDAAAWRRRLSDAIGTFIAAGPDELDDLNELQLAVDALGDDLRRAGITGGVPLAVVQAALAGLLDESVHGGVPTGQVTFASMASLRNLPFEVVCMIGLGDGAFPTSVRAAEYDLMRLHARRGDRQRAEDERNLFLDLVLAARRRLYLSYVGHSVRDNSSLPPSCLVSELLDFVCAAIAVPGSEALPDAAAAALARRRLTVSHPLQAFAPACFARDADPRLRSRNREMGDALRAGLQAAAASAAADAASQPAFFTAPLPVAAAASREVSLAELAAFFRHPARYLLRHRMQVHLHAAADELADEEPFLLDRRGRRLLAARVLPRLVDDPADPAAAGLMLAGTEMPTGNLGRAQADRELYELRGFAAMVRGHLPARALAPVRRELPVEVAGESWRVTAELANLRATGLVIWKYAELRGGGALPAELALQAWLEHLALCSDPPAGVSPRTVAISRSGAWVLRAPADPRRLLAELVAIYREGLAVPVHFFPRAAWAYCRAGHDRSRAAAEWYADAFHPYAESADPACELAFRGQTDPLDGEFDRLARTVFDPLLAHCDPTEPGHDA